MIIVRGKAEGSGEKANGRRQTAKMPRRGNTERALDSAQGLVTFINFINSVNPINPAFLVN